MVLVTFENLGNGNLNGDSRESHVTAFIYTREHPNPEIIRGSEFPKYVLKNHSIFIVCMSSIERDDNTGLYSLPEAGMHHKIMYTERIPDVLNAADQNDDDLSHNEDSVEEDNDPQNPLLEPGQVIEFYLQGKPELDEWKRSAIIYTVEEDAGRCGGYHISTTFHVPL